MSHEPPTPKLVILRGGQFRTLLLLWEIRGWLEGSTTLYVRSQSTLQAGVRLCPWLDGLPTVWKGDFRLRERSNDSEIPAQLRQHVGAEPGERLWSVL